MPHPRFFLPLFCMLLCAALFGFFYAWVCSTMWGLDTADPRIAIVAMQAMNASVRNAVFAPAFFGTPLVLLITTIVLWLSAERPAAIYFGAATGIVAILSVGVTLAVNVPMNEALAILPVPQDFNAAQMIWDNYSPRWQFWNQFRTVTAGLGVLLIGLGMLRITRG